MSDTKKTIVISGGGTGGHIYPAIAIAQEFRKRYPNEKIIYIGKKGGREEQVVGKAGFPVDFCGIAAQGFPRRISPALFTALYHTLVGFKQAMNMIKEIKPKAVIGTGGYVSANAVLSAQLLGIPTMIHEQNAFPGITNRILGKKAKIIATAYQELDAYFKKEKINITGNPVRDEFLHMDRTQGLAQYNFQPNIPTVLVFGGSQGAMAINRAVLDTLDILDTKNIPFQVILQTGEKAYPEISAKLKKYKQINCVVQPYLYNIENAYAVADLVIARAGAISISEIMACGLPSILIPYPFATANHQEMNARAVEKNGAAVVVLEKDLTAEKLAAEWLSIVSDSKKKNEMAVQSKKMGKPGAAGEICDLIESILN